jgi:hypothetical protein
MIPPSRLQRSLRTYRTVWAVTHHHTVRRVRNIVVAKALGKVGFWRAMRSLWR